MSEGSVKTGKTRKSVKVVPPAIEIAEAAKLRPIDRVARKAGLLKDEIEFFGRYKAKVALEALDRLQDGPDGKLVLVTGMTPTSAGEGKTVTTIGLGQALGRMKIRHAIALREPSLGPVFGIKGGAAGGGYSQIAPMAEINLHFTGDLHAITAAHNLLSAVLDNHIHFGNEFDIDPDNIVWPRVLDVCDRQLRFCEIGLGRKVDGFPHRTNFDITAASEVMAVLALASGLEDLKERLGRMIVAYNGDGKPVFARDMGIIGAMAVLLKDALKPNLVQTLENTPAFVHCGPFANIAHGCNSIMATRLALKLGDYAVTEAGFGADLGAEKFMHIKCPAGGISPSAVVIVASCRALKVHGGVPKDEIGTPNARAVEAGFPNLQTHIENIRKFGLPVVVALNRFPNDTRAELNAVIRLAESVGVPAVVSEVAAKGGRGGVPLAEAVLEAAKDAPEALKPLYNPGWPIKRKIETLAREIYRAGGGVDYSDRAESQIRRLEKLGFGGLPLCMAKTQMSISDQPKLKGAPRSWTMLVRDLRVSSGAGFIVVMTGNTLLMPGMPQNANAVEIDLVPGRGIVGLF
jgi:formate--tetrahydrofolate ligase